MQFEQLDKIYGIGRWEWVKPSELGGLKGDKVGIKPSEAMEELKKKIIEEIRLIQGYTKHKNAFDTKGTHYYQPFNMAVNNILKLFTAYAQSASKRREIEAQLKLVNHLELVRDVR